MTDRRRELLHREGPAALSIPELLSIILRTGQHDADALELAHKLLAHYGSLQQIGPYSDLLHQFDLRPAQAAQVMAALELGRRMVSRMAEARPIVQSAADAARLVQLEMEPLKQEELRAILLDVHRRVMAVTTIYIGSLNTTVVRAAEVFREAIARNCASLILAHNHPSGDATPSKADISMTEDLVAAGRLLDIAVLDHIIIGHGEWVSLRDTGVGF